MKRFLIIFLIFRSCIVFGQSTNDILNVLIANKTITQQQADSLRADYAIAQQNNLPEKRFQVEFEFRPRTEYRNGYQQLRNDTTTAAFFTNQRSRLSLNYTYENRFILQFSAQDLRVWGQQDPRSTSATIQAFEAWAEIYLTAKLSVRAGRQKLVYDNQRLFAENDWRLSGAVHDALNFRYYNKKIAAELAFAANQTAERYFGTDYSPKDFSSYKYLIVSYIKYSMTDKLALTLINSTDGFQAKTNPEKTNFRYTLGGRVELSKGPIYGTISGYYQGGRNPSGKDLSSYYFQPEVRFSSSTGYTFRLGLEYFSGTNQSGTVLTDNSFVPLYGVSHRFNGSMDLIVKFPNDVGGAGLINPYFFAVKSLSKKIDIRADFHTFSLQKDYYLNEQKIKSYLGFENDFLVSFKPNPITKIDAGFSYMLPTKSMEIIKGSGNSKHDLYWAYLSLTFRPVLFTTKFK